MFKSLMTLVLISTSSYAADFSKSICGVDDRIPSYNPKVARALMKMTDPAGCTMTLISRSCAISAGHCRSYVKIAEFNTPLSRRRRIQHPAPEDIYEMKEGSLAYDYTEIGNDWAVLRLKPNAITGKYPGDVQGYYNVSLATPIPGQDIRITGYGEDRRDNERNFAQQTNTGKLASVGEKGSTVLTYADLDTMGGNSGSSIILEETQEIIGIHTNGGCYRDGGYNSGTMISGHEKFIQAINNCLASERDEL